ncbi:MAG: flagellar biosynthesis protein FlhF [Campylobacterota bacterium]|nr:flagellar biosynthesis protein FlhF [Campylobacterota bacterium]
MKILTFSGATPAEALKRAQGEVGEEAMLIETRELQKKALGKSALYEIVVGIDEDKLHTMPIKKKTTPVKPIAEKSSEVLFNISEAAKQISQIADVTQEAPSKTPGSSNEDLKLIKGEISKLTDKVKLIQNMFWDEKSPDLEVTIPSEFAEIYKLSLQSGMSKEHLDEIMKLSLEHMPSKMRESSVSVKRYFQTLLRKMVPVRLEKEPNSRSKKVIMLVGPTGVGKTTSIAKLAARYSYLMDKNHKVGLVVLDTYRIGAVEQLMQYARMMKLGIETVVDPPEFANALESLRYCDYILIDTMGSSPYDKDKIEKIYECLHSNDTEFNVDVVLVMPSSIKYEDMQATYDNFSTLGVDTVMFTKLDETRGFGNIFSLVYETKKPISYFSIGQEVPEDLVAAKSEMLIDCLLHGFDRSRMS